MLTNKFNVFDLLKFITLSPIKKLSNSISNEDVFIAIDYLKQHAYLVSVCALVLYNAI